MADFLFDEIIKVLKIDSQVVYDKVCVRDWFELKGCGNGVSVSRINAESEDGDSILELDVHTELYPMLPGEKYRMGKQKSLADKFEYVMHGLLYKMSEVKEKMMAEMMLKCMEAYISFGGLQMLLKSDPPRMHKFRIDQSTIHAVRMLELTHYYNLFRRLDNNETMD
ncbi:DNA-directed RNA polymerases II and V subunitA [Sesamum angolense]|uniref:DNA-directed RNA polymerases II and V subunitA n=1 Tax=Sesamum angolense TaxID=2727404 RepID=A0AAE2C2E2_9LAMI|nr:DNA-directed RNA polymerases II and V subunitA [Sesamum angolense]